MHIVTCVFIVEIVRVCLILHQQQLVYRWFLEYVANAYGSCFLMKGTPLSQTYMSD